MKNTKQKEAKQARQRRSAQARQARRRVFYIIRLAVLAAFAGLLLWLTVFSPAIDNEQVGSSRKLLQKNSPETTAYADQYAKATFLESEAKQLLPAITVDELRQMATENELSSVYTPVVILRNGDVQGCGTLWESPYGLQILTAAHLFPVGVRDYFNFAPIRRLTDISFINKVQPSLGTLTYKDGFDAAIAIPGERTLVQGFEAYSEATDGVRTRDVEYSTAPLELKGVRFRSLLTGEFYPCVGTVVDTDSDSPFLVKGIVLPLLTRPGESGSGFVTDEGDVAVLFASDPAPKKEVCQMMGLAENQPISSCVLLRNNLVGMQHWVDSTN